MTSQMQDLLARIDGVREPIAAVSLIGPIAQSAPQRNAPARRCAHRRTAAQAGVISAQLPRALRAAAEAEPGELHEELLAAGLL